MRSRKTVAVVVGALLMGVQLVIGGVFVALGKASFAEYRELSEAAITSLAGTIAALVVAIGLEDAAAKHKRQEIDVNVGTKGGEP
jgi:hypothetical protein